MDIGVPREASDTRVAATPTTVAQLRKLGYHVFVETGAGLGASSDDDAYREVGGVIVDNAWDRDIVLAVGAPSDTQLLDMHPGATLISFLAPRQDPSLTRRIAAQGINAEGLRRRGFSPERIAAIKHMYRLIYRQGLPLDAARQAIQAQSASGDADMAADARLMLGFLANASRGIVR